MVLIKTLLYTGVRVAELIYSRLALTDAQASYDQAIGPLPGLTSAHIKIVPVWGR